MISHKYQKHKFYNSEKDSSKHYASQQYMFSDLIQTPLNTDRFIGNNNSANINHCLEEAFLKVACVIDKPTLISQMTVCIKQPNANFNNIAFDLIRISRPEGKADILGDNIVFSLIIPAKSVKHTYTAFSRSSAFTPVSLNKGDLIALRVDPGPENTVDFYATATVT